MRLFEVELDTHLRTAGSMQLNKAAGRMSPELVVHLLSSLPINIQHSILRWMYEAAPGAERTVNWGPADARGRCRLRRLADVAVEYMVPV